MDQSDLFERNIYKRRYLVESFIQGSELKRDRDYFTEMTISEIENSWNVDLSAISNTGKTEKRFDFVIKTDNQIYVIETNFYASNGSKLNETARSYKTITKEVETIEGDTFEGDTFMWVTDGKEWESARNNLEEIFDILEHIYSINDLENGIIVSNKIN